MRISQKSGWINNIEKRILDGKLEAENREVHNILEIGTSMISGPFGDYQSILFGRVNNGEPSWSGQGDQLGCM